MGTALEREADFSALIVARASLFASRRSRFASRASPRLLCFVVVAVSVFVLDLPPAATAGIV